MMREVQERIDILENSIKVLERILENIGQNNDIIQKRIKLYKRELRIRRDFPLCI
ncbi:MAG: hypothetical protein ACFE8N_09395 [Promethearchaeota archaeon]